MGRPEPLLSHFVRAASNEIDYDGQRVHASWLLDSVAHDSRLAVRWVAARPEPVQGLQLHSRGGALVVAEQRSRHVVLWRDTAPDIVELRVVADRRSGGVTVAIRNTWRSPGGESLTSLGNAGIVVDATASETVLRCSDGDGPVAFDDLVVAIAVRAPGGG